MATFHSFGGVDIHAVFGDVQFGELQMVSYKSDREKAPVYTMGSPDPRTTARGKRIITGACVFVVFEKDTLLEVMNGRGRDPWLSKEENANYDEYFGNMAPAGGSNSLSGMIDGTNAGAPWTSATKMTEQTKARLADQLLPFDIVLVGANEYGKTTQMSIQGVEFMSEASGISIDDLVIEKQMSFIARHIQNWDNGVVVAG